MRRFFSTLILILAVAVAMAQDERSWSRRFYAAFDPEIGFYSSKGKIHQDTTNKHFLLGFHLEGGPVIDLRNGSSMSLGATVGVPLGFFDYDGCCGVLHPFEIGAQALYTAPNGITFGGAMGLRFWFKTFSVSEWFSGEDGEQWKENFYSHSRSNYWGLRLGYTLRNEYMRILLKVGYCDGINVGLSCAVGCF